MIRNNRIYVIGISLLIFVMIVGTILLISQRTQQKILPTESSRPQTILPMTSSPETIRPQTSRSETSRKPFKPIRPIHFDIISGGPDLLPILPGGISSANLTFNKNNLKDNQNTFYKGDSIWNYDEYPFYIYDNGVAQSIVDFDQKYGKVSGTPTSYYSKTFWKADRDLQGKYFNTMDMNLGNYLYVQLFGPLFAYLDKDTSSSPDFSNISNLTNLPLKSPNLSVQLYVYQQNQIFYINTQTSGTYKLYVYNYETKNLSTYIIQVSQTVLPNGQTGTSWSVNIPGGNNAVFVGLPRVKDSQYTVFSSPFLYIGPEFQTSSTCQPICSQQLQCGGYNGCGGFCPNTTLNGGSDTKWVLVNGSSLNGIYGGTLINNKISNTNGQLYFQGPQSTQLLTINYQITSIQGVDLTYVSSSDSKNDQFIGIPKNGKINFIFNPERNYYETKPITTTPVPGSQDVNKDRLLLIPISCNLPPLYQYSEASEYAVEYVDENNKLQKTAVYKENEFDYTRHVNSFLNKRCILLEELLATYSPNFPGNDPTYPNGITIIGAGPMKISLELPTVGSNGQLVLNQNKSDFYEIKSLSTIPPHGRITPDISVKPFFLRDNLLHLRYGLLGTGMVLAATIYMVNTLTGSYQSFVLNLIDNGRVVAVPDSNLDSRLLNFQTRNAQDVAEWFIPPIIRNMSRFIVFPELGRLYNWVSGSFPYISGYINGSSRPDCDTVDMYEISSSTPVRQGIRLYNGGKTATDKDKCKNCCPVPRSMNDLMRNPTDAATPSGADFNIFALIPSVLGNIFPGIDTTKPNFIINFLGNIDYSFEENTQISDYVNIPALSNVVNSFFTSNNKTCSKKPKSIAFDWNSLMNLANKIISIWVTDKMNGITLKYNLDFTNLANFDIKITNDFMDKVANYYLSGPIKNNNNNLNYQILTIGSHILDNMWSRGDTTQNLTTPVPYEMPTLTPAQLEQLPRVNGNGVCERNKKPIDPYVPTYKDYQDLGKQINPVFPNSLSLSTFRGNISQEQIEMNIAMEGASRYSNYNPVCPDGQVAVKRNENDPYPNMCQPDVSPCPVVPTSQYKCSANLGGLNNWGGFCKVIYINSPPNYQKIGTNYVEVPTIWRYHNNNTGKTFDYIVVDNGDGSYTMKSQNKDSNLRGASGQDFTILVGNNGPNNSTFIMKENVTLEDNVYIIPEGNNGFYLDPITNNYYYIENPDIYFQPITNNVSDANQQSLSYFNDDNNCGMLGNKCPDGFKCCGQKCVPNSNFNDPKYIDKCYQLCQADEINAGGVCVKSKNVYSDGTCKGKLSGDSCDTCLPGLAGPNCDINIMTDNNNCGQVGKICQNSNCLNGECRCNFGFNGPECQYSDAKTCSGHGKVTENGICLCSGNWQGGSADTGFCNVCPSNFDNSDGTCTKCAKGYTGNKCEINLNNDPNNCGQVGKVCSFYNPEYDRTDAGICSSGLCYNTNTESSLDGNPQFPDRSIDRSPHNNCGKIGNKCPDNTYCCNGTCLPENLNRCGACSSNCSEIGTPYGTKWDCCNHKCTNIFQDSNNCGSCGQKCPPGQKCVGGTCTCLGGSYCKLNGIRGCYSSGYNTDANGNCICIGNYDINKDKNCNTCKDGYYKNSNLECVLGPKATDYSNPIDTLTINNSTRLYSKDNNLNKLPGCSGSSDGYLYVLFTKGIVEPTYSKIIKGDIYSSFCSTYEKGIIDYFFSDWRNYEGVDNTYSPGNLYGTSTWKTEIIVNFQVTNKYTGKSQFIRVYHSSKNYNLGVSTIPSLDFDDYGQPDYSNFKIFPATSSSTPAVVVIGPPL